ncbi:UDP-N-acetylmuramoyl-L-alanyl-D-glutamate--2,6-diaminopimelate ligase [Candidatus Parcubacteria bacterium]|nr:UDP-N-acetylmuramoyl-L-alanyl-D-glutamate--2,6-diaminopimelate ligase [Candidatus Parcubacteria bacterium]
MNLKKIVRKVVPKTAVKILEESYRKGRGLALQARYGFPARGMRVIAVTGTNGKSTTCAFINEVLKAAGYKTAVLTTVFYEVDGQVTPNKTHFTIDRQSIVQSFFAKAKNADVDFVIFEVTSHALDQHRIMGVKVEIAAITNLTQEHLDYHGTMQEYARAKSLLLREYGAKQAILNIDDEWYEYFRGRSKAQVFTIGTKTQADLRIKAVKLDQDGSSAELAGKDFKAAVSTNIIGEFNLYNAAVAAAVGNILNLDPEIITKGIANLKKVDGRMQRVEAGQNFEVFVDFAITPDAIEQALLSLRQITKGKLRIVFGATGDRDKQKRPKMGEVAAKCADYIYLTDDETYTEEPALIREAVYKGIKAAKGTKKTIVIPDRREAIAAAFKDSQKGDAVLLTGIGHEDTRNIGGRQIPWNEAKIAEQLLKGR